MVDLNAVTAAAECIVSQSSESSIKVRVRGAEFWVLARKDSASLNTLVVLLPCSFRLAKPETLWEKFGLTRREVDVALLLADRRSNREIAEHLGITRFTAERHTSRILKKLAIRSRLDVARVLSAADVKVA